MLLLCGWGEDKGLFGTIRCIKDDSENAKNIRIYSCLFPIKSESKNRKHCTQVASYILHQASKTAHFFIVLLSCLVLLRKKKDVLVSSFCPTQFSCCTRVHLLLPQSQHWHHPLPSPISYLCLINGYLLFLKYDIFRNPSWHLTLIYVCFLHIPLGWYS